MRESDPILNIASAFAYSQSHEHLDKLHPADRTSIVLSRQAGTREEAICEKLTHLLIEKTHAPWNLYDRNLIDTVLKDHQLPVDLAKYIPEDKGNEVENLLQEIVGLHPSSWTLFEKTSETIFRLAQRGHVILVGRAANIICAGLPQVFSVRLIGSYKVRVEYIQNSLKLSYEDARAYVDHLDGARKGYAQKYFNEDIDNPLLYHITIHTDRFTDDYIASLIADGVVAFQKYLISKK
ncbi:MAG: hypothetical protein B7X06_00020 [Verrucomicrobia bacterium 21-51-4]|nr:MAG: hypothetical protein B7X06_00020 [Verrucomicrobia bacterium 21-51-4]HQU08338.1 cytidylate kinase-like family protein [Opitutales bacterium]